MSGKKNTNLGNTNNTKFKTSESRKKLCQDYIKHIETGLSDECFPECDPQTLKRYIELYPSDFATDLITKAKRMRRLFWEEMGIDGTRGKLKRFNAKSWEFNMKNRFKEWRDKQEVEMSGSLGLPQLFKKLDEDEKKEEQNS